MDKKVIEQIIKELTIKEEGAKYLVKMYNGEPLEGFFKGREEAYRDAKAIIIHKFLNQKEV